MYMYMRCLDALKICEDCCALFPTDSNILLTDNRENITFAV